MLWFKRKRTNRRAPRSFILDVKLRAEQIRQRRFRFVTGFLTFIFVTVFAVFLLWRGGQFIMDALVFKNPAFAVETIEVQTDGVISAEMLRRLAGVKTGDNLLALDLAKIKRDLELVPLIQSAAVERLLPHTLRLRVSEREPVGQVLVPVPISVSGKFETHVYLLDAAGFVMPQPGRAVSSESQNQPYEQLPVLLGVNSVELRPGHQVESPQVRAALRLLAEFEQSAMASVAEVRSVDVTAPEVLKVTTRQGSEITFSANLSAAIQLRRWAIINTKVIQTSKAIAALDLSITNNIPVRTVDASSVPPVRSKVPKPYRKKNV